MLPESMAPPLVNYDRFQSYMTEREVHTHREYMPETEFEGEVYPAAWHVVIGREQEIADKTVCAYLDISDHEVELCNEAMWDHSIALLDALFQRHLEEAKGSME